jgi:hypothetical protein
MSAINDQRRIVAELDALQAEVDALKRLQAEPAAELLAEYQKAQAAVAEAREKLRRELETALTQKEKAQSKQ